MVSALERRPDDITGFLIMVYAILYYFDTLCAEKSVIIPDASVDSFCKYANSKGIYPMGGAILENGMRVLYLG